MRVTGLGHSSYLLTMSPPASARPLRLLADPWLSDFVIGDLLGRFPRIRYCGRDFEPLDGIFVSHSHTDHLDPYTLVRLWSEFEAKPPLLLPESLRFLEDLFREHLTGCEIVWLENEKPLAFRGVELMAFFNPETRPTNEDDVMVLTVDSGSEIFLCEADAVLPFYDEAARSFLSALIDRRERETACFLTIKNEGEATMAMLAARSIADRRTRLARSLERTYEEIWELYADTDGLHGDDDIDIWQNGRLVRLIAGQGICFPQSVDSRWNRVLFPIRLSDRVRMEREVAAQTGCAHGIDELVAGATHLLETGALARREPAPWLELLDEESERDFELERTIDRRFSGGPLHEDVRSRTSQRARIGELLNERFLPHFIGARRPPFEHFLAARGGEFRVRVRYGGSYTYEDRDWRATFRTPRFEEGVPSGEPAEHYWANDLEDVLDGRADEFSTFAREPLGGSSLHVWTTLGLPFLNCDLIEKKLRLHFERASAGEPVDEWVLAFHRR